MKRIAIAAATLLLTHYAGAAPISRDDPKTMVTLWYQANDACRGGPGDSKATWAACDEREAYGKRLDQLGWCYGKRGQYGYQMKWHVCTPSSLRPSE